MWNPVMWSSKQWQACMLYVKGAGRRHNQYGCHSGCKTRSLSGGKRWYGSWQTVCFGLSFLGPEIRGQKNNSRVNLLCFQNKNPHAGREKLKRTFSLHGCLKMLRMSVWYYIHMFLLSVIYISFSIDNSTRILLSIFTKHFSKCYTRIFTKHFSKCYTRIFINTSTSVFVKHCYTHPV